MEKSILKNFTKYVTLNIIGMIGLSCYILADTYFVSKALGLTGIASLNLSIPIYSVIHGIGLMIGIGGASRYSILKSQNKPEKANIVFSTAMKSGVMVGIILVVIGVLGSKHLALTLGADGTTLSLTKTYLTTILSFAPFFILNNILLAFVRNDNNPKLSMIAMLAGSLSNVVLDYIFIFPLNMGMFGAAFATGLAPIISILVLLFHFTSKINTIAFLKINLVWDLIHDIFSLGLSSFIIEVSSAVVLITFNIVILNLKGNLGIAAYGIVANLALVVIAIFTGVAQGAQPLVSKSFGQDNYAVVKKVRKYALITTLIIAIIIYSLAMIHAERIIQVFNSEYNTEVAQMAEKGIIIYFLGFFFAGINIVAIMVLSATENIREALYISMSRGLIIIVPSVLILSKYWGMTGVWFAFLITEAIVTVIGIRLENAREKIIISIQKA